MKQNYKKFFLKTVLVFFFTLVLSSALFAQAQYGWLQRAGFPGRQGTALLAAAVGNRGYIGLGHINSIVDVLYDELV